MPGLGHGTVWPSWESWGAARLFTYSRKPPGKCRSLSRNCFVRRREQTRETRTGTHHSTLPRPSVTFYGDAAGTEALRKGRENPKTTLREALVSALSEPCLAEYQLRPQPLRHRWLRAPLCLGGARTFRSPERHGRPAPTAQAEKSAQSRTWPGTVAEGRAREGRADAASASSTALRSCSSGRR